MKVEILDTYNIKILYFMVFCFGGSWFGFFFLCFFFCFVWVLLFVWFLFPLKNYGFSIPLWKK